MDAIYIITAIATGFAILIFLVFSYCSNPFDYPHITIYFNLSGKRQPDYMEYVDDWINSLPYHRQTILSEADRMLADWDYKCNNLLSHCLWASHKQKMYNEIRGEIINPAYRMFEFVFVRNQTRYHQQNYQRQAYTVQNTEYVLTFTISELLEIDDELEEIDHETTRAKYYTKNQRKLMTKELREVIKRRDNYTCQICGKYMPDGVGLHVDHIIPIKKGGKTVESNLQVLCDKCNLGKGSK